MMKPVLKILITGGCGFIGHHFVEHFMKNTDWEIIVLDKLTYASNGFDRLRDISVYRDERVRKFTTDIVGGISDGLAKEIGKVDYIIHLAAETHVDNSISDPEPFVITNVVGTFKMLEYARTINNLKTFVYFSTDEVFGPAPQGIRYKEWDRYNSTNPYSASKAGGEELALAWANTYGLPVMVTHTMNAFGERQHPEKFIPKVIKMVLAGEEVVIHSDETLTVPGSRYWIHARNIAVVTHILLGQEAKREKYNIVGECEVNNLEMAQNIASIIGKKLNYRMVDFHSSRPGHDLRYALDGDKLIQLGFTLPVTFKASLEKTVKWYIENPKWLGLGDRCATSLGLQTEEGQRQGIRSLHDRFHHIT